MRRFPLLAAALVVALASVPAPAPVHATILQKCQSADGTIGYTDGNCAVFGDDAVAISSRVIDQAPAEPALSTAYPMMDARDTGISMMGSAPGRRSPADGCARTPTQLAMDLRASLALGDVNRVAESYDWAGMSNEAGQRTLDRLQQLVDRPVLDSRYLAASYGAAGAMYASSAGVRSPGAGTLQLIVGGDDGPGARTIDFDVHQVAGCYFVSF